MNQHARNWPIFTELPKEPLYAMICRGTCMLPEIEDGAKLVFSSTEAWTVGDTIAIFRRPEKVKPGQMQVIVKKLVVAPPKGMTFPFDDHPESEVQMMLIAEQMNPPAQYLIPCSDVLGIHKCLGPVPDGR